MMNPETAQRIKDRCREVWEDAKLRYGLQGRKLKVKVVPHNTMKAKRGAAAGTAGLVKIGDEWVGVVRLNALALAQNLQDMLDDTIPHEIAHVVCRMDCRNGSGHDAGWQRVCKALGGTGLACFTDEYDLRLRKRKRYVYNVDGARFTLTDVKHGRLQRGTHIYKTLMDDKYIRKEHWTGEWI